MMSRYIRVREVMKETGLSRTTLWRRVRDQAFPAPYSLSANCIGWRSDEVETWKKSRSRVSYAPPPEADVTRQEDAAA